MDPSSGNTSMRAVLVSQVPGFEEAVHAGERSSGFPGSLPIILDCARSSPPERYPHVAPHSDEFTA